MLLKGKGPVKYLNRDRKACMIEAFLVDATETEISGFKILDIGCGNGQISTYFSQRNEVCGVDIEDMRESPSHTFDFHLIGGDNLPFDDNSFDIVLSHHVIEHVADQASHLSEISRVLKTDGTAYLGCPNKGSPFMAGHVGNQSVPTWADIKNLFNRTDFTWEEYYTRLLSQPYKYHCELKLGQLVPSALIKVIMPWYPSHCFILRKRSA